jgi:hypothetical protein
VIPDPFTGTFRSTPEEWKNAVVAGKQFLDATCKDDGTWCPMTINAWNEWSEGAYIEPDERYLREHSSSRSYLPLVCFCVWTNFSEEVKGTPRKKGQLMA